MSASARPCRMPSRTASSRWCRARPPTPTARIWPRHRWRISSGTSARRRARRSRGGARVTSIAITGYASLDHVVRLEGPPLPDATVDRRRPRGRVAATGRQPVLHRRGAAPRRHRARRAGDLGGGGRGQAGTSSRAWRPRACRWTGWRAASTAARPSASSRTRRTGRASASTIRARAAASVWRSSQGAIVDAADWVCVTVGPATATRAILARLRSDQRLAWVVKADGDAFPPALRAALAARADLIVCSRGERPFVADALEAVPGARGAHPGRDARRGGRTGDRGGAHGADRGGDARRGRSDRRRRHLRGRHAGFADRPARRRRGGGALRASARRARCCRRGSGRADG